MYIRAAHRARGRLEADSVAQWLMQHPASAALPVPARTHTEALQVSPVQSRKEGAKHPARTTTEKELRAAWGTTCKRGCSEVFHLLPAHTLFPYLLELCLQNAADQKDLSMPF